MNIKKEINKLDKKIGNHRQSIMILETKIKTFQSLCKHEKTIEDGYGIQAQTYCDICGKHIY